MCARSSDRRARGFTMVELVAVLLLVAVLAAVVMPRLDGAASMRGAGWRDQVLAALRHAHSQAQGHRRLVCASVTTGAVTLTMATANPATGCSAAMSGADGNAAWARDGGTVATSVAPAGTLYFQPSGRITSDGAGSSAVNAVVSVGGEPSITVVGETGHVE